MSATNVIEIIINAKDNSGGVLGNAQSVLGGIGKLAAGALTVGLGAATAAFGALAVGIGASVQEAMQAENVQAQLGAVIKSTGGIAGITAEMANDLAASFQNVTRFEDDAILSGENILLTFTNIGKNVFPAATETILNMSQALGQDLQSSAVQLGKALQDPIAGVSALSRVGVNFTDAQKDLIKSLVESGQLEEAQTIILNELAVEFGGAATAAGKTFAGQLDILNNRFGDIKERIGTAVIPILKTLLDKVVMPLMPALESLADVAVRFFTAISENGLIGAIEGLADEELFQQLLDFLGISGKEFYNFTAALDSVSDAVRDILSGNFDFATLISPGLLATATNLRDAVLELVDAVISSFPKMGSTASEVGNSIATDLGEALPIIINGLANGIRDAAAFWREHGGEIIQIVGLLVSAIGTAARVIAAITTQMQGTFGALNKLFSGDWLGAMEVWRQSSEDTSDAVLNIFGTGLPQIKQNLYNGLKDIVSSVKLLSRQLFDAGRDIIFGLINGIKSMGSNLWSALYDIVYGAINQLKSFFGIRSPSTYTRDEIGAPLVMGIANRVAAGRKDLETAFGQLVQGAAATLPVSTLGASSLALAGSSGSGSNGGNQFVFNVSDRMDLHEVIAIVKRELANG